MAIIYGLKVNLSVAMVAMLNHTAVGHGSHGGGAHADDPEACKPPGGSTNATTKVEVSIML